MGKVQPHAEKQAKKREEWKSISNRALTGELKADELHTKVETYLQTLTDTESYPEFHPSDKLLEALSEKDRGEVLKESEQVMEELINLITKGTEDVLNVADLFIDIPEDLQPLINRLKLSSRRKDGLVPISAIDEVEQVDSEQANAAYITNSDFLADKIVQLMHESHVLNKYVLMGKTVEFKEQYSPFMDENQKKEHYDTLKSISRSKVDAQPVEYEPEPTEEKPVEVEELKPKLPTYTEKVTREKPEDEDWPSKETIIKFIQDFYNEKISRLTKTNDPGTFLLRPAFARAMIPNVTNRLIESFDLNRAEHEAALRIEVENETSDFLSEAIATMKPMKTVELLKWRQEWPDQKMVDSTINSVLAQVAFRHITNPNKKKIVEDFARPAIDAKVFSKHSYLIRDEEFMAVFEQKIEKARKKHGL